MNITTIARTLRASGIALGSAALASTLATIVLWDADFYEVRHRWETFKEAMFGEWTPGLWCPPGRQSSVCDGVRTFEDAFAHIVDFNFFVDRSVEGTDLKIVTGTDYASSTDVLAGRHKSRWCYIKLGAGDVVTRVDLGGQRGTEAPIFSDLTSLPAGELAPLGLDIGRLRDLARSHCQFGTT